MPTNAKTLRTTIGQPVSVDRSKRILSATITTKAIDRDGDIVDPEGLDFINYLNNPIVLWAHDNHMPPVAKVLEIYKSPNAIMADIQFAETKFAQEIFDLFADGFLNAWSIGFTSKKDATIPMLNDDGMITGYHFQKTEMLELSAVPVPANPDALTRGFAGCSKEVGLQVAKAYQALNENYKTEEATKIVKEYEIETKQFTKSSHTNDIQESEQAWGSIVKDSLPLAAFAWEVYSTNPEDKATWKHPHHWVKDGSEPNENGIYTTGTLLVSKSGLKSAWNDIMCNRDSTGISIEAINHLQKHRIALGLNKKRHCYIEINKDSQQVYMCKDFEKLEKDDKELFVKSNFKVKEGAFDKSCEQRMSKGMIPTILKHGEEFECEVDFEIVQEKDGIIVEAKVHQVGITLAKESSSEVSPATDGDHQSENDSKVNTDDNDTKKAVNCKSVREVKLDAAKLLSKCFEI